MGPEDGQTVAKTRQSVRDFGEVILAQFFTRNGNRFAFVLDRFCAVVKEGAMVGCQHLDGAVDEPLPEPLVIFLRAHRRRADPFGAVFRLQVFFAK